MQNKNTRQNPMSAVGKSGTQVVKFIPAPRVYIKAAESLTAAPVQNYQAKTQATGDLPAAYTGWTDLGIVNGNAKLTYEKKLAEVRTGLDGVLRDTYIESKTATLEFTLQQFDDVALEAVTGLTASVITSGSVVNYQVGQDDVIKKAILLVLTSKIDGKEIQLYHPSAILSFNYDEADNAMVLKVTASLPAFTASGTLGTNGESFFSQTIFSA
jgi:hypothetical protein